MKTRIAVLIGLATASSLCLAGPGTPADSGFAPLTSTFYVNTNLYNLDPTEHPSVDIAANGNVIFSWENDGDAMTDFECVWTLYDSSGNLLTPPTLQTNRSLDGAVGTYESATDTYLSFFRSDNTAIGPYTGWGGNAAKANKFGNGVGFAAMCWEIGLEIPELYDINADDDGPPPAASDAPYVQLLNNDGTPLRPGVISGTVNLGIMSFADADVQPAGSIRTGGWDYLSNGNIVLAGQSQQAADRALTGQSSGNVPVYRIMTPSGTQVHAYAPLSLEPIGGNISAGIGVTASGWAARWDQDGVGATIRLFNNAGTATPPDDINLATLSGHPEVGQGGEGGGGGFHGNGVDAYVNVNPGGNTPWVTVINADGTLRWSRKVQDDSDPIDNSGSTDVDGAIDQYGRVVVVFSSLLPTVSDPNVFVRYIQARLFSKDGVPLGPRFVVSEWENPSNPSALYDSTGPRVAWRGNKVAFCWLGGDAPTVMETTPTYKVLAARMFAVPVYDNFNDGNDSTPLPPWSRYNPIGTGSWSFPGGKQYRLQTEASPSPGDYGPGRAGSYMPGEYTDFCVMADIVAWDDSRHQVCGVMARIGNPGPGSTTGYLFTHDRGNPLSSTAGDMDIVRLDNEQSDSLTTSPSGGDSIHLVPGKSYRLVFTGVADQFRGRVYELPNLSSPVVDITASDSTYASGMSGLVLADNSSPNYDQPADATFDNFLATTAAPEITPSLSGSTVTLSWPLIPFNLLSSPSLSSPSWTTVTTGISQVGNQFQYATPAGTQKFYRLSYP
jgi:hypothetical protein